MSIIKLLQFFQVHGFLSPSFSLLLMIPVPAVWYIYRSEFYSIACRDTPVPWWDAFFRSMWIKRRCPSISAAGGGRRGAGSCSCSFSFSFFLSFFLFFTIPVLVFFSIGRRSGQYSRQNLWFKHPSKGVMVLRPPPTQ